MRILFFSIIVGICSSCGQGLENKYEGYSELEIETEKCLDTWMKSKDVEFNDLITVFENYFVAGEIINVSESIDKQYQLILSYWEKPTKQFPIFEEKKKVIDIKNKLGLSEQDIKLKTQLDCFFNIYIENKANIDTTTSFFVFGSILETIKQVPDISPGLIAGSINSSMNKSDLKKSLYQKLIALMYCFDMSQFLNQTNTIQNNVETHDTLSELINLINTLSLGKNVDEESFELKAERISNSSINLVVKSKNRYGIKTTKYMLNFDDIDLDKTKVNKMDNTCFIYFFSKNGRNFKVEIIQESKINTISLIEEENFYIGYWQIDSDYDKLLEICEYIERMTKEQ